MTLTLVTPPDYYHNSQFKSLIVNPSEEEKTTISDCLKYNDISISVYLYDNSENIEWLLNVTNTANTVYINVDNSKDLSYYYLSYLVSQPNVTWKSDRVDYSIINKDQARNINEYIQKHWLD